MVDWELKMWKQFEWSFVTLCVYNFDNTLDLTFQKQVCIIFIEKCLNQICWKSFCIPYPRKLNAGVLLESRFFYCTQWSFLAKKMSKMTVYLDTLCQNWPQSPEKVSPGVLVKAGVLFARIQYANGSLPKHDTMHIIVDIPVRVHASLE